MSVICLIGPPSSGKGTISEIISQMFSASIITPGNIYASLRQENSELGNLVKDSLKDGGLCPDWLTNEIMMEEAKKVQNQNKPMVFDGYPRTLVQLDFLDNNFDVSTYLHINATYQQLKESALNRRKCPKCNKIFSLRYLNSACDCVPFEQWIVRFDDTPEMFEKRYKTYLQQSEPIIARVQTRLSQYVTFNAMDYSLDDLNLMRENLMVAIGNQCWIDEAACSAC